MAESRTASSRYLGRSTRSLRRQAAMKASSALSTGEEQVPAEQQPERGGEHAEGSRSTAGAPLRSARRDGGTLVGRGGRRGRPRRSRADTVARAQHGVTPPRTSGSPADPPRLQPRDSDHGPPPPAHQA